MAPSIAWNAICTCRKVITRRMPGISTHRTYQYNFAIWIYSITMCSQSYNTTGLWSSKIIWIIFICVAQIYVSIFFKVRIDSNTQKSMISIYIHIIQNNKRSRQKYAIFYHTHSTNFFCHQ